MMTNDHQLQVERHEARPDRLPDRQLPGPSRIFAVIALVVAVGALAVAVAFAALPVTVGGRGTPNGDDAINGATNNGATGDDGAVADPTAQADDLVAQAAVAMAEVTSVEFELERAGAPIYIDQFESIALDSLIGQFTVPGQAAARLAITVDGNLSTYIGAIAIGDEVWISNPVTGNFETLPAGYDIDPSKFFDPTGGWEPLLASLQDIELIGIDDRGGERYHVRGQAPAAEVTNITVGLVRDQAITIDLWIHPDTGLVTAAEFATTIDGAETTWRLQLSRYGDTFIIEAPANLDSSASGTPETTQPDETTSEPASTD